MFALGTCAQITKEDYNVLALRDRIPFGHLSSAASLISPDNINLDVLLPSQEDYKVLVSNFCTLVARILLQQLPGVQYQTSQVKWHTEHQYSHQISHRSEVVCALYMHILFLSVFV